MTQATLRCPFCRTVTAHPRDIAVGYCVVCHRWTSEPGGSGLPVDELGRPARMSVRMSRWLGVSREQLGMVVHRLAVVEGMDGWAADAAVTHALDDDESPYGLQADDALAWVLAWQWISWMELQVVRGMYLRALAGDPSARGELAALLCAY